MNDSTHTEVITQVSPAMLLAGLLMSTFSMNMPDAQSAHWRGGARIMGTITDERLDEISGLAASSDAPYLWAHNDSGDEARLFLIDERGGLAKVVKLEGMKSFDAEDLSVGPCAPGTTHRPRCLFLGDIGDNRHQRAAIVVHRIKEPSLAQGLPDTLQVDRSIWLMHPEGKPMDTEALMSHPTTGELYMMEKSRHGESRLLRVPNDAFNTPTSGWEPAELIVEAHVHLTHANRSGRLITSGTFSPDGQCLVLRTYLDVLTYCKSSPEQSWQHALDAPPDRFTPPAMLQSEAIAFDMTGSRLWVASERRFSPLLQCLRSPENQVLSPEKK